MKDISRAMKVFLYCVPILGGFFLTIYFGDTEWGAVAFVFTVIYMILLGVMINQYSWWEDREYVKTRRDSNADKDTRYPDGI